MNKVIHKECEDSGHIWEDHYNHGECIRCGEILEVGEFGYCDVFSHNWEDFEDTCKCSLCNLVME